MCSRRSGSRTGSTGAAPADLSLALGQALLWCGFRQQSIAALSSGPFARRSGDGVFIRQDPSVFAIAFVIRLDTEADLVGFIDHQGLQAWGYDLNHHNHAHQTEVVNELHFVITRDGVAISAELPWIGYAPQAGSWLQCDPECAIPALGPAFTAPIYPCLGWVLLPSAVDEFGAAEQRSGFCTTDVPEGASANHATRAFSFVYGGYPQRIVTRRRIVTLIDPARSPTDAAHLVQKALAFTYGDH
ncbi:MAG: hypothetical protein Q8O26_11815 [Phreatobacter sp.]|uniref:hypothetical protein n=1 Tax=Phreatobacter sp. TaxID=1966341 RepID=UPI002734F156|nr:hypothetical protein [Phreatobacter sp.]MDP2802559.1 hypothetical protein [Phreatobacter sp.]